MYSDNPVNDAQDHFRYLDSQESGCIGDVKPCYVDGGLYPKEKMLTDGDVYVHPSNFSKYIDQIIQEGLDAEEIEWTLSRMMKYKKLLPKPDLKYLKDCKSVMSVLGEKSEAEVISYVGDTVNYMDVFVSAEAINDKTVETIKSIIGPHLILARDGKLLVPIKIAA